MHCEALLSTYHIAGSDLSECLMVENTSVSIKSANLIELELVAGSPVFSPAIYAATVELTNPVEMMKTDIWIDP